MHKWLSVSIIAVALLVVGFLSFSVFLRSKEPPTDAELEQTLLSTLDHISNSTVDVDACVITITGYSVDDCSALENPSAHAFSRSEQIIDLQEVKLIDTNTAAPGIYMIRFAFEDEVRDVFQEIDTIHRIGVGRQLSDAALNEMLSIRRRKVMNLLAATGVTSRTVRHMCHSGPNFISKAGNVDSLFVLEGYGDQTFLDLKRKHRSCR